MDVREKLVELANDARMNAHWHSAKNPTEYVVDYLIAHGVTVQEWISVKDRLPERYGMYLCRYVFDGSAEYPHFNVFSFYAHLEKPRFQGEGSCGMCVTHWMPLPQPPKGVLDERKRKQTNADRIRAMSDEELADVVVCPHTANWDLCRGDCKKCRLEWLKQPAEEDHHA